MCRLSETERIEVVMAVQNWIGELAASGEDPPKALDTALDKLRKQNQE